MGLVMMPTGMRGCRGSSLDVLLRLLPLPLLLLRCSSREE
jgi:hypothetical protein